MNQRFSTCAFFSLQCPFEAAGKLDWEKNLLCHRLRGVSGKTASLASSFQRLGQEKLQRQCGLIFLARRENFTSLEARVSA